MTTKYATRPNTRIYTERPGVEFVVGEGFSAVIPQIIVMAQTYQRQTGRGMYVLAYSEGARGRVANASESESYAKLTSGTRVVISISPEPKNLVGRTIAELKKIIPNSGSRRQEK